MNKRTLKRISFIILYLLIFSTFGFLIFLMLKPDPSCFDGIQNQGEERIDCGGPCKPCPKLIQLEKLQIKKIEWVVAFENRYDAVAKIKNLNNDYGAASFRYQFIFRTIDEKELARSQWQEGFILPSEEKYLFAFGTVLSETPSSVELIIDEDSIQWEGFDNFERPVFFISNLFHEYLSGGTAGFFKAQGDLINRNSVDFETIVVKIVIRDAFGKLVAVNQQMMNTVRSGERRSFIVIFPYSFSGNVTRVEVEPETNIFNSDNYIRVYGNPESWKSWE